MDSEASNSKAPSAVAALFSAAYQGNFKIIEITARTDPKIPGLKEPKGNGYKTLLHLTAYGGKVDACEALIDAGLDKDARDDRGATPLHMAAMQGKANCVKLLLDRGANIIKNNLSRTPLHEAAFYAHAEALINLIPKACEYNMVDVAAFDQRTPLHDAALSSDPRLAFALLDAGAKINELDNKNRTPLDWAWRLSTISKDDTVVKRLKDAGAEFGHKISRKQYKT